MLNHRPVAYMEQAVSYAGQPQIVVQPDELVVTADCPACATDTTQEFYRGVPGSKGVLGSGSAAQPSKPVTMICACGYPHAGRPDGAGESGCGAYWSVPLP